MEKRKTNILLELIDDIISEYQDTKEYIQQKLLEKREREGILIDTVIFFVVVFLASLQKQKHFYKPSIS